MRILLWSAKMVNILNIASTVVYLSMLNFFLLEASASFLHFSRVSGVIPAPCWRI